MLLIKDRGEMMNSKYILIIILVSLLVYMGPSMGPSSASQSANKVMGKMHLELMETTCTLNPHDTVLVWIDINATVDSHNDYWLPADPSLYGIKWVTITFSPDINESKLLWLLSEIQAKDIENLIEIPWVFDMALVKIGGLSNKPSMDSKLSPGFREAVNRALQRNGSLEAIVYIEETSDTPEELDANKKCNVVSNITVSIRQSGGRVRRVTEDFLVTTFAAKSMAPIIENPFVSKLYLNGPVIFCGKTTAPSSGNTRGSIDLYQLGRALLFPATVSAFILSVRGIRKKMLAFLAITIVLSSAFMSQITPIAWALNVSTIAIRATDVWTTGNRGGGINVAIIDSGIDLNNNDFANAIVNQINIPDGTNNVQDTRPDGHGTHVAGIVAGRGVNNPIYRGIAWEAGLVIVRVETDADLALAVQWVINNRVQDNIRVISSSVGPGNVPPGGDGLDSPYSIALDDAVENGIVVVQGAGNGGPGPRSIMSPGNAFNVITVGAVQDMSTPSKDDDVIMEIPWGANSARGPTGDGRPKPDVVAPGMFIRSVDLGTQGYDDLSGTSQATAHVAGSVALVLNANPDLTPGQVKAILRQTAILNTHLSGLGVNDRGHGIVDAYDAVQLAPNVDGIFLFEAYDSFSVQTPNRHFDEIGKSWDWLEFMVEHPHLQRGISISTVNYRFRNLWGLIMYDYKLLNNLCAPFVWIDGTFYNLGYWSMPEYLFSGPRIYEKGSGYVRMRALFRVNNVMVNYDLKLHVDEISFFLSCDGGSSWKTQIYINPEIWDPSNFPQLESTGEVIYYEKKVTGNTDLYVRDLGHAEHLRIYPIDMGTMWVIRGGYIGSNPDFDMNDEYTYDQDIAVCYQGTSSSNGIWIYQRDYFLPAPNPPPYNLATPDGPNGISRQTYPYTTSSTSQGNTIHYEFDWGDGSRDWTGWFDSGVTATAEHSWTYSGTYNVKVRAEDSNGAWSDWSESLTVTINASGTGCPTLFVWNGTDFTVDNNLLPKSARSNGTEVEDYYRIEQDLIPFYEGYFNSYYSLKISEFQQEHSYLDEVDLFAVDHATDVSVAVSPTGEILTYQSPYVPISAVDENDTSWLDELSEIDGEYYESYNGSFLVLNFGEVNSSDAKFILRADPPPDGPPTKTSIHIQVLNSPENWLDAVSIIPRTYWSTDIIDLSDYLPSDGELVVRLYFTDNHRVDFVGLDTTPQAEIDIEDASLLWAYHSNEGFVTAALHNDDDVYAELIPDQQITLLFAADKPDAEVRTFIFYVKGYYTIIG